MKMIRRTLNLWFQILMGGLPNCKDTYGRSGQCWDVEMKISFSAEKYVQLGSGEESESAAIRVYVGSVGH